MTASNRMRVRRVFPVLLLLLSALHLMAATYAPSKLVFTGADQYKAADLTTVTGLTPGKQVTTEEIDAAMQKLVDTGLFSDMRYTVNGQALTFMLTPVAADQLLTARYKNFVWGPTASLRRWWKGGFRCSRALCPLPEP
ncbi:POTRA domain-containing protein [Granulicella aggregans]|nr:POTRA domain-containing protein [Granulicella aggregans]